MMTRPMKAMTKNIALILACWVLSTGMARSQSRNLVILTTFSEAPLSSVVDAFQSEHPDISLKIIYRRTTPSLQLLRKSYSQHINLILTSSPFLMQHLLTMGKLQTLPDLYLPPAWLQKSILLPKDKVGTIGYSGAGVVWNRHYFKLHHLPTPTSVKSLLDPVYFGHVTMSSPTRSGTTQLMIESLLARYGWEKGWRMILGLGANLAAVSSRSFGVSNAIADGRVGAGITIDSYPIILNKSRDYVEFTYDPDFTIMPAYIGVMADSQKWQDEKIFLDFLLSSSQQQSMHQTGLLKYAVQDPALQSFLPVNIDINTMSKRELGINLLFDLLVTQRLPKLQEIQKQIIRLSKKYPNNIQVKNGIEQAKHWAFDVPISLESFNDSLTKLNQNVNLELSDSQLLRKQEVIAWSYNIAADYKENLTKASQLLAELESGSLAP